MASGPAVRRSKAEADGNRPRTGSRAAAWAGEMASGAASGAKGPAGGNEAGPGATTYLRTLNRTDSALNP
jgi:hypothetical protein